MIVCICTKYTKWTKTTKKIAIADERRNEMNSWIKDKKKTMKTQRSLHFYHVLVYFFFFLRSRSFCFLQCFIRFHTEKDAYHLIHLLFITLLNVLKSVLWLHLNIYIFIFIVFVLVFFFFFFLIEYINSGHVQCFAAIFSLIAFWCVLKTYWLLWHYVNCAVSCFWDISNHQINTVTHKSYDCHLIYIGLYWF